MRLYFPPSFQPLRMIDKVPLWISKCLSPSFQVGPTSLCCPWGEPPHSVKAPLVLLIYFKMPLSGFKREEGGSHVFSLSSDINHLPADWGAVDSPTRQDDFSPPQYKPSEPYNHGEFPINSTSYAIFQRIWFYLKISATVWNSFFPCA